MATGVIAAWEKDIDLARARGEGPRVLKRFLDYAETGRIEAPEAVGEPESPFEEDVAAAIRGLGYAVEAQVGDSGFRLDLAVRHPREPGRYMLAVECDGATYHSAPWARERDRLRQEVLENLGWRFHRVWSTDWFYRRGAQIERLRDVLAQAEAAEPASTVTGEPSVGERPEPRFATVAPGPPADAASGQVRPYRLARLPVPGGIEPHEAAAADAARVVAGIVEQEGPVHRDEVARRYAALFGRDRAGSRIGQVVDRALHRLAEERAIIVEDAFAMTPAQWEHPPVRDRAETVPTLQKAIAPRELRAAMQLAERANGPLPPDAMASALARLLGLGRAGPDLKAAVRREMQRADVQGGDGKELSPASAGGGRLP